MSRLMVITSLLMFNELFIFFKDVSDFTAMDEVFELKSTQFAYEFNITITNDDIVEEAEHFIITLSHVTEGGNIDIDPDETIVNIADNDCK